MKSKRITQTLKCNNMCYAKGYFTGNFFIPLTLLDKTKQRIRGTVTMKLLPSQ